MRQTQRAPSGLVLQRHRFSIWYTRLIFPKVADAIIVTRDKSLVVWIKLDFAYRFIVLLKPSNWAIRIVHIPEGHSTRRLTQHQPATIFTDRK
jgi:hypothetical protein